MNMDPQVSELVTTEVVSVWKTSVLLVTISIKNQFKVIAQKGATSKIGDFEDISKILTYGFRV